MILYHGTNKNKVDSILKKGLLLNGKGFISLTPSKEIARGYGAMSGEKDFRKAKKRAKTVPLEDRVIIIIDLPSKIHYEERGSGLIPRHEYRIFSPVKPEQIKGVIKGLEVL